MPKITKKTAKETPSYGSPQDPKVSNSRARYSYLMKGYTLQLQVDKGVPQRYFQLSEEEMDRLRLAPNREMRRRKERRKEEAKRAASA